MLSISISLEFRRLIKSSFVSCKYTFNLEKSQILSFGKEGFVWFCMIYFIANHKMGVFHHIIKRYNQSIRFFCTLCCFQNNNRRSGLVVSRPPREHKVMGSIPGRNRPKSLKLVVVAFPLGTQDYGNSTMTGPPVSGYWTG